MWSLECRYLLSYLAGTCEGARDELVYSTPEGGRLPLTLLACGQEESARGEGSCDEDLGGEGRGAARGGNGADNFSALI